MVCDGIENQFFGLELRIDILVGVDFLSDVETLLRQFDLRTGNVVYADAGNAVGGDVDQTRTSAHAEGDQMSYGLDVHHLDVIACREVLHVGHTVDDRQLLIQMIEGTGFCDFCGKCSDTLVEMTEGFCTSEIVEIQCLDTAQSLSVALGTDRTEYLTVETGQQFVEDVDAEIACGSCQQHIADRLTLAHTEGCKGIAVEKGVQGCIVSGLWGVEDRSRCLRTCSSRLAFASADECSESPRGLQTENVVEDNLHTVFAGLYDHFDGIDTRTANLKEIVSGTHLFDLQYIREDTAEELFCLALRSLVFSGTLHLWCGQCLTVDLAIRCHRHGIHPHIGVGHHIVGQ